MELDQSAGLAAGPLSGRTTSDPIELGLGFRNT
jgi:hypothetical protein